MKKFLNILFLLVMVATAAMAHSYTDHSLMQSGKWLKLSVTQSGLHRISYGTLRSQGFDPASVRIYGYGGAMLSQDFTQNKLDDMPEIAVYDNGSELVFYAQGPVSWAYNNSYKTMVHTDNPYSLKGYYFVSNAGEGSPKRISQAAALTSSSYTATTFTDMQLHEQDLVNLVDPAGVAGGGREWYGEQFAPTKSLSIAFNFPNIVTSKSMNVTWCCAANGGASSSFQLAQGGSTQSMSLEAIGNNLINARTSTRRTTFTPTGDALTFTLKYNANSTTCKGYLNYVEVNATRNLTLSSTSGPLYFQNLEHVYASGNTKYTLSGASESVQVWDVSEPHNMQRLPATLSSGSLQFIADNANGVHRLVAIDTTAISALPTPTIEGNVQNQDLHGLQNIQYVVITNPTFKSAADRLALLHQQKDSLTTAVVTADQVYNEFSSGTPDATAYRWFMKMFYDRYRSGQSSLAPKYLVLMGDGSFDNRQILASSAVPQLLTYQAVNSTEEPYAMPCDDYFTWLDDNEGTNDRTADMDIAVGRLPVNTAREADLLVSKLEAHRSNSNYSNWRNQLVFLADDGDVPNLLHTWQADSVVNYISSLTQDFQVNRIFEEAYNQEVTASGESYPLAQNQFNNLMNGGMLYMNYTGHGSPTNITSEGMLSMDIVNNMSNQNLGLWALATCSFSHFDRTKECIGETAVLNPTGGALAVFSSTRTVYASMNLELNKQVSKALFTKTNNEYPTIGEAVQRGKNVITNTPTLQSADQYNRLAYTLLGDPASKLSYPTPYWVVTDSINGIPVSAADTLRALQSISVSGYIADDAGAAKGDFNGQVNLQFFDKAEKVVCKDNDHVLNSDATPYSYYDRQSILFKGSAPVSNGRFNINFRLPKDIKYNYGSGRFVYYAYDPTSAQQAHGHYESFTVGGSFPGMVEEEDGPDVTIYLNTPNFESGDQVNTTPTFFAQIHDTTGINTAGSGIGHDLLLMVDDDPEQTYTLNEYFQTGNSYRDGSLTYQFAALQPGKHTLLFRAWDLLNNSTTKTLDFEVVEGLNPGIISVLSYPNPVAQTGLMTFNIQHDRPNTALTAELYVYDLSGRLMHKQSQSSADQLQWNVSNSGVPAGVYIYQIRLKSTNSSWSTKSAKVIVY